MKITLTIFTIFFSTCLSFGQCIPDTSLVGSNFYFAPANSQYVNVNGTNYTILPYAQTGVPYSENLQFKVPTDTLVNSISVTIDYLKVIGIVNLPSAFQVNCNPTNCTFPGGSFGCSDLSGTAAGPDSILLKVAIELKVSSNGNSIVTVDTIRDIIFVIQGTIGLDEESESLRASTYPNPADEQIRIEFESEQPTGVIRITDVNGKIIYKGSLFNSYGLLSCTLNTSTFPEGMYLYTIENNSEVVSDQFMVNH